MQNTFKNRVIIITLTISCENINSQVVITKSNKLETLNEHPRNIFPVFLKESYILFTKLKAHRHTHRVMERMIFVYTEWELL